MTEKYRNFNLGNWFQDKVVSDSKKEQLQDNKEDREIRKQQQMQIMNMLQESYSSNSSSKIIITVTISMLAIVSLLIFYAKNKKNAKKGK